MNLHAPPGSWFWLEWAALTLLYGHILGGAVAMVAGMCALLTRKGGRIHRLSGNVFFVAMLVMAGVGATVAPFIGQPSSSVAGALALYLVITGWVTGKRAPGKTGWVEGGGMVLAFAVSALGVFYIVEALHSPTGTVEGQPAAAFYVFGGVGALAGVCDLTLLLRGRLEGRARIARHVWRMCLGLMIATVSFFLGQEKFFPKVVRDTPGLYLVALSPLGFMVVWLGIVWLGKRFRPRSPLPVTA